MTRITDWNNNFKMEFTMKKNIIFAPIILSLIACGSEDMSAVQGLTNVSNVSGNYSMITSTLAIKCSDGSTSTESAIVVTGSITHSGNRILFDNDNAGEVIPGITILESDDMDGAIEPSGRFIMTSSILMQADGISGNITANYNLSGYFNDTGWSGDYVYSVYAHASGESCDYSTTFSGNKEI